MNFKTSMSMLAAAAASMLLASPAQAVDPNLGSSLSNPYGVAPYSYGTSSTVPIARDRYGNIITAAPVDGVQSLSFPTRIAMPDYSVNGTVPVSPIATIGSRCAGV